MGSILIKFKPDAIGSIASTLCIIHCLATPFIFITQACTMSCCADAPLWWQSMDYIFILIAFFAIYRATKTSINQSINKLLWTTWLIFFMLIINKTTSLIYINPNFTYIIGCLLALLHLYNLKYCQCQSEICCINK